MQSKINRLILSICILCYITVYCTSKGLTRIAFYIFLKENCLVATYILTLSSIS
nr:MAG TPA: hypothetical protein [Caudoviricetes sp.]DAV93889.1 MAG TPA: hypothetical protein [Caudoviricetes sp.]